MFSCIACGTATASVRRVREGQVCIPCARFLRRAEPTFEPQALIEAEETKRIEQRLLVSEAAY